MILSVFCFVYLISRACLDELQNLLFHAVIVKEELYPVTGCFMSRMAT